MKKGITLLLVCLVALASAVGPSLKEWNGRYQSLMGIMKSKDSKAFGAYFASDFVLIDKDGKSTSRADFLKSIDGMFAQPGKVNASVTVKKVTANGDMVDVSFDFRLSLKHQGGTTQAHEVGVDTWKKVKGKWMFAKTVDKRLDMTEKK